MEDASLVTSVALETFVVPKVEQHLEQLVLGRDVQMEALELANATIANAVLVTSVPVVTYAVLDPELDPILVLLNK